MQVREGDKYLSLADSNRLRQIPLWPLRGIIRDRHGAILAENAPRFQATVLPRDVPLNPSERETIVGEASRLLGKSYVDVNALVTATSTHPDDVTVLSDAVPYAQAIKYAVALPHLPGFHLEAHPMRHYPWSDQITSLSHVLGYVGKLSPQEYEAHKTNGYRRADEIGKTGLERSYETALRGKPGSRLNEVDARGRIKGFAGEQIPLDGQDLTLTLDIALQKEAEDALKQQIERAKAARGSVVVTDPRDGAVLALVSWPSFNNNDFAGSVSSTVYHIVKNRRGLCFTRHCRACLLGSTIQNCLFTCCLGRRVNTDTSVASSGGSVSVSAFFPDWKAVVMGSKVTEGNCLVQNDVLLLHRRGYGDFRGLGVDQLRIMANNSD